MELCIPPSATGDFGIEKNYLHIWPRGQFMMIGLPNQVNSNIMKNFKMPCEEKESMHAKRNFL